MNCMNSRVTTKSVFHADMLTFEPARSNQFILLKCPREFVFVSHLMKGGEEEEEEE